MSNLFQRSFAAYAVAVAIEMQGISKIVSPLRVVQRVQNKAGGDRKWPARSIAKRAVVAGFVKCGNPRSRAQRAKAAPASDFPEESLLFRSVGESVHGARPFAARQRHRA
jgi:hypothetical protein